MIPKVIWSYWNNVSPPSIVQECVASWKRAFPEWQIRLLNNNSVEVQTLLQTANFTPPRNPSHFADWLRLSLLAEYGGLWMDGSILINSPKIVDNIVSEMNTKSLQVGGFFYRDFQTLSDFPVLESWCIVAPHSSQFVKEWRDEFNTSITKGFEVYRKDAEAKNETNFQKIYSSSGTYLTIHATAQVVFQRWMKMQNVLPKSYAYIVDAQDGPFVLHTECAWNSPCIGFKSWLQRDKYAMVKMRGIDRVFMLIFRYGFYVLFAAAIAAAAYHLFKK